MSQRARPDSQVLPPSSASLPFLTVLTAALTLSALPRPLCSLHFGCQGTKGTATSSTVWIYNQDMQTTTLKWVTSGLILHFARKFKQQSKPGSAGCSPSAEPGQGIGATAQQVREMSNLCWGRGAERGCSENKEAEGHGVTELVLSQRGNCTIVFMAFCHI